MVVVISETQAGGRTSEDDLEGGPFRALQTERIACVNALRQEGRWLIKGQKGGSEAGMGRRLRGRWTIGGWRRASPSWAHLFPKAQDPEVWAATWRCEF